MFYRYTLIVLNKDKGYEQKERTAAADLTEVQ